MDRRISLPLLGLCALLAVACGQRPPAASNTLAMSGPAPLDAALVTAGFGWVLTPDELLLTRDGGATFTATDLHLKAGQARAAYFRDETHGLVASASAAGAITVERTSDAGRTWQSSTLVDPAGNTGEYSAITVAFNDKDHGAFVARTASSPAFSLGTLFATTDGGATWSVNPAPEAGQVSVDTAGRIWVAGTALNVTGDQGRSWTPAKLDLAGPAESVAVSAPVGDTVPVTLVSSGKTHVELLTTTDQGRTWGQPIQLPVQAKTGPGVRLPVAGGGNGLVVFDAQGGHVYRGKDGADLRPSGLPDGVRSATFAAGGKAGWALATYGTCRNGKQDCVLHNDLMTTTDSGTNWRELAVWSTQVS
jgi:hypothetical protein